MQDPRPRIPEAHDPRLRYLRAQAREQWTSVLGISRHRHDFFRLDSCPSCQAWRSCHIDAKTGKTRCYECGQSPELDAKILKRLGIVSNASVTKKKKARHAQSTAAK